MAFKEQYLTADDIDNQITAIRAEINLIPDRARPWDARISNTALLVTDMQNYFLDPDSHAFIPSAHAIINNIYRLISYFRNYHKPIIFTKHIDDEEKAGSMSWWWNDLINANTVSASLIKELDPGNDIVMVKNQYDAFYGTSLSNVLKSKKVQFVVICGVMTNLCCETSVRTAFVEGFRPVLPIDATATYSRHLHIATFRNLAFGFAPLMTTAEVIQNIIQDA